MSQAAPVAQSTPASSLLPDSTDIFTAAHFVWIGLFALIVVIAIVWGVRQKAKRKAAVREIEQHNADIHADAPSSATLSAAPAASVEAPPVSPPPPPQVEPDVVPFGAPPAPVAAGPGDASVTQLKGLGPKVAERLAQLGVTTVGQIAALNDDEASALDSRLGTFSGRMARDRWQEQARFLAAGDRAGFEAVFGKLDGR